MDDRTTSTDHQKHGKFSNWKKKGKLSELDRLKKRQKELQIMKLSQEWDARRHKRKMDRIQWLQQRKDQVISQNEATEASKTNDEARESQRALTKANNSPVSSNSTQGNAYERHKQVLSRPISTEISHRTVENTTNQCEVSRASSSENEPTTRTTPNQVYKSVVVKTERLDSDRLSNSNFTSVPRQINSRNSGHIPVENRKRRKKDAHDIHRRTVEEHLEFHSSDNEDKLGTSAYESLVNLVNSQPAVEPPSSVIAQAMKQSGLDEDEDILDDDMDSDEPSLLMASEPVRFEEVLQGGGTNIQRLPTRSVEIMQNKRLSKESLPDQAHTQHRSHSRDSVDDQRRIRKAEAYNQGYPKIKQCYSLMAQDSKSSTPLPSPSSTQTGSPIATIASSSYDSTTINEVRNHPVAHTTSSSQSCPPSGYLVPVYKPSADEVVYAFVPSSGDSRVHPGPPDIKKTSADTPVYIPVGDRYGTGLSAIRNPTATIHHGRHSALERAEYPHKIVDSHQPTSVTWVNVQSTSAREKHDHQPKSVHIASSSIQAITTTGSQDIIREPEVIVKPSQNPGPVVTMLNGYSSHNAPQITDAVHDGQGFRTSQPSNEGQPLRSGHSTPEGSRSGHVTHEGLRSSQATHEEQGLRTSHASHEGLRSSHTTREEQGLRSGHATHEGLRSSPISSNPDTINNPTAVYVRPRLVPREIVVPYHAGSGNVPIVEYIKTDVICDKDLANWTAHNVAEFISATDCSDSAKIFIEQDIDGKAVLLLSQDIFVNRLNLKLGTAIKLYNHVANLRSALLM